MLQVSVILHSVGRAHGPGSAGKQIGS